MADPEYHIKELELYSEDDGAPTGAPEQWTAHTRHGFWKYKSYGWCGRKGKGSPDHKTHLSSLGWSTRKPKPGFCTST